MENRDEYYATLLIQMNADVQAIVASAPAAKPVAPALIAAV